MHTDTDYSDLWQQLRPFLRQDPIVKSIVSYLGASPAPVPAAQVFAALSLPSAATIGGPLTVAPAVATSGLQTALTVTGAADTGQTSDLEKTDVLFNLNRTIQLHASTSGILGTQRSVVFAPPTLSFVGGVTTVTKPTTVAIVGPPVAGSGATFTNPQSLWIQAGTTQLDGLLSMSAGLIATGSTAWDYSAATGPFKTSQGLHTFGGRLSGTPAAFAIPDPGASGAISVTSNGVVALVSAGAETRTLADPTFLHQRITLCCDTHGGDIAVTGASAIDSATHTHATFTAAGQALSLVAISVAGVRKWRLAGNDGVTLS